MIDCEDVVSGITSEAGGSRRTIVAVDVGCATELAYLLGRLGVVSLWAGCYTGFVQEEFRCCTAETLGSCGDTC